MDNYERHKETIEKGPYIKKLDLAVSCALLGDLTPMEMTSCRVTWELLERWELAPEMLFKMAEEDSRNHLSPMIEPMSDVLKGFLMEEFLEDAKEDMDKALINAETEYRRLFGNAGSDMPEIYVLSNELRIKGAAVIFYTDILKKFSEELGEDLILLPSSIHEWLILPAGMNMNIKVLEDMVREANTKVVTDEEVLSEHVYIYSREKAELFIAGEDGAPKVGI